MGRCLLRGDTRVILPAKYLKEVQNAPDTMLRFSCFSEEVKHTSMARCLLAFQWCPVLVHLEGRCHHMLVPLGLVLAFGSRWKRRAGTRVTIVKARANTGKSQNWAVVANL